MKTHKISVKTILLYLTFTALTVMSGGVFDGLFAFGAYVGALYATNPIVVSLIYLASSLVYGLSNLLQVAIRVAVMMLFVAIHYLAKRKINKFNLLLYVVLANVFYLSYGFQSYFALFDKILYTVCGVAFGFVSLYVFRALFVRGLAYQPALDERICIAVFMIVATFSLSQHSFLSMDVVYFVLPFVILFCSVVFDDGTTFATSILLGMGNLFATGKYDCLVFCVMCALVCVAFGKISRYVSALGVLVVDVAMSYFLGLHGNFYAVVFAPTITSVLVFMVIPSSVYNYCNDCFCGSNTCYATKSVTQKITTDISKRLYRLSDIFMSIKNAFYTLSEGKVNQREILQNIVKQSQVQVCQNCKQRTVCWRQNLAETEKYFVQLCQCALQKGKCTILDIPQGLSVKCDRVAMLLSNVNSLSQTHKQLVGNVEQKQSTKLLVAEQMAGVSSLMLQLATDYQSNVTFDTARQRELVEMLVFHNVLCIDGTIFCRSGSVYVVVTVAKKDLHNPTVEKCCSAVVNQKMVVQRVENTANDKWVNVYLVVKPRFGVEFGVSYVAKKGSEISADTHSQLITDNGKCIVSLCDGMGSGDKAEKMSNTVMSLVESYFRAGFDSNVVLSCINQLLTQSGNEIFCAMDMAVIDLYNGFVDFVKLGSPAGFLKSNGKVEIVKGSSLPLGVLEEMKPSVTQKVLNTGDMVVLVSDGIIDCFNDVNVLAEIFANVTYTTPQSVAETIMSKTLKKCGDAPDDMTVVVAKIS